MRTRWARWQAGIVFVATIVALASVPIVTLVAVNKIEARGAANNRPCPAAVTPGASPQIPSTRCELQQTTADYDALVAIANGIAADDKGNQKSVQQLRDELKKLQAAPSAAPPVVIVTAVPVPANPAPAVTSTPSQPRPSTSPKASPTSTPPSTARTPSPGPTPGPTPSPSPSSFCLFGVCL